MTNRYHEQAHAGNLRRMPRSRAGNGGGGTSDRRDLELLGRLLLAAVLAGPAEQSHHHDHAGGVFPGGRIEPGGGGQRVEIALGAEGRPTALAHAS